MTYNGSVTLPSDAAVAYDTIKFIWEFKREKLKSSNSNEGHKQESNEISYNEDEDHLKRELDGKENREIFSPTMNECL